MFCEHCGIELGAEALFCWKCGHPTHLKEHDHSHSPSAENLPPPKSDSSQSPIIEDNLGQVMPIAMNTVNSTPEPVPENSPQSPTLMQPSITQSESSQDSLETDNEIPQSESHDSPPPPRSPRSPRKIPLGLRIAIIAVIALALTIAGLFFFTDFGTSTVL